jgi:GAF domain-containing protein
MRRRSRVSSKLPNARRRKAKTVTAARHSSSSVAGQETEFAQLARERDEALLRETANSEILRLISKSPGDLELVFRSILENATRICNANFGSLFRFDGEKYHPAAQFNTPAALLEALTQRGPFKPIPGTSLDHVMRSKQVFHSADMTGEPGLSPRLGGARSQVTVPMLKDEVLIGAILIYRQEVRPFTDKQIELVQNFAAQAVIAIENARLLNELRQSLEQQTAAADVLRVISSSLGELEPVFNAMLENATRLCEAKFGTLYLFEDGKFCPVALVGASPEWQAYVKERGAFVPTPEQPIGQLLETRRVVQAFADTEGAASIAAFRFGGARVFIAVPMLNDDELVGAIAIFRQEARPFTDKQIELVKNFAAQAVIAIENARLLNELRQRTNDLSESLEQQTATSEVLKVISSSPGELEPVFQAILENATRICGAKFANLLLYENGAFRRAALFGAPSAWPEGAFRDPVIRPNEINPIFRIIKTKEVLIIPDLATEQAYLKRDAAVVAVVEKAGARSIIGVPMLKESELERIPVT